MAKKKGGGEAASKKTTQKKKQQIVEDKTFGLKNKNKSKKVQQQVNAVIRNVMNSGDPKVRKQEEERQRAKTERKARAKAAKEEQEALFGAALMAVQKKSTLNKKEGQQKAQGRDGNDEAKKTGQSRAMKMMYQMDAQEMSEKLKEDPNYVPTLEDEIEDQRQKKVAELKAKGQPLTTITEESFAAWQQAKRERKQLEMKRKVEAELKKKKGGKGLSVLSGRDLYEYKRDLFKDDQDENDDQDNTAALEAMDENDDENENEEDTKLPAAATNGNVDTVAAQVQSDLFLEGDDDDLDDLDEL